MFGEVSQGARVSACGRAGGRTCGKFDWTDDGPEKPGQSWERLETEPSER